MARVCVVGLGRVGTATALLAAEAGHDVVGVDRDPKRLEKLQNAQLGDEPQLRERWLAVSVSLSDEVVDADIHLIAVETPLHNHSADLSSFNAAVEAISRCACQLVIIESTVPVHIPEHTSKQLGVEVVVAPERVLPGNALYEIVHNPRVIGGTSKEATATAAAFFRSFVEGPIHQTTCRTAALCKLIENASRDVSIAFANEVEAGARALGVNPAELWPLVNAHPRVNLLTPSVGVGGHCLPVDPWFYASEVPEHSRLIQTARAINEARPHEIVKQILSAAKGKSVGCLGITYKPNSDDLRHSPAKTIINALASSAQVLWHDPFVSGGSELTHVLHQPFVVCLVNHDAYRMVKSQVDLDVSGLHRG